MNSKLTNVLLIIIAVLLVLNFFKEEIKKIAYPEKTAPVKDELSIDIIQLMERKGLCYAKNETVPYTGIITSYYPNGGKKYSVNCDNGTLNGEVKGLSEKGKILLERQFTENKLVNIRFTKNEDGDSFSIPETDSPLISLSYLEMFMIQMAASTK